MKLSSIPSGKTLKLKKSLPHEKPNGHLKLQPNNLPSASISGSWEKGQLFLRKAYQNLETTLRIFGKQKTIE
jgi:hypothetical protein